MIFEYSRQIFEK